MLNKMLHVVDARRNLTRSWKKKELLEGHQTLKGCKVFNMEREQTTDRDSR